MESEIEKAFYSKLDHMNFEPGWALREPHYLGKLKFKPAIWRWSDAKRALDEAGRVVSTQEAERRNLTLKNPIDGNPYPTTRSLISAYQMVLPGERARSHRHAAAALRLVVDTEYPGMYTLVNGVRIDMAPGDVVLTPAFCWHGHANETSRPGYWIDFLDVPFVARMGAMAFQPFPQDLETIKQTDPKSPFRIPPADVFAGGKTGVIEIAKDVMPTIGLHLIRQLGDGHLACAASPANQIYSVISGHTRFTVEGVLDETLTTGDIIAMPCWHKHTLTALDDSTVLRVCDEPMLKALGLLPGAHNGAH